MAPFFLRLPETYNKYILQKKWTKTVNPALSSGQHNLLPAIWGCHRQLDDHYRNPNINNKDHVGQLTRGSAVYSRWWESAADILWCTTLAMYGLGCTLPNILTPTNHLSMYWCWMNQRENTRCKPKNNISDAHGGNSRQLHELPNVLMFIQHQYIEWIKVKTPNKRQSMNYGMLRVAIRASCTKLLLLFTNKAPDASKMVSPRSRHQKMIHLRWWSMSPQEGLVSHMVGWGGWWWP